LIFSNKTNPVGVIGMPSWLAILKLGQHSLWWLL